MTAERPLAIFVYGTLKREEINHVLLAPYARSIESASIRGTLYDAGDFPALVEGTEQVHGQIVRVDDDGLGRLLPVLDRLEGYQTDNAEQSLYLRRVIEVTTVDGAVEPAFAYFYNPAHPSLPSLTMLRHLKSGEWTGGAASIESSGDAELDDYREWVRTFRHRWQEP